MKKHSLQEVIVKSKTDIEFKGMTTNQSINYQLEQWVKGRSIHNPIRNECCPDFSCCSDVKIFPEEVRIKFSNAYKMQDRKTMFSILGMALADLTTTEQNLVIIDDLTEQ